MANQIAGKYMADVDPSKEMASAKIQGKLSSLSPSRGILAANPRLAFGAGGLGFNERNSAYYS
jgi:hypothetical protein